MDKHMYCPKDHGAMRQEKVRKHTVFRGENIVFQMYRYVCEKCGVEIDISEQTASIQNAISDAYRKKVGLLSGAEMRKLRKELGWSQRELAKRSNVGVASIKRWENGLIQTRALDYMVKVALYSQQICNRHTGNRTLSIPRIKRVMKEFERELGFDFLTEEGVMLYDSKYLWYADMVSFRILGKSITGGTYAALPQGPHLNNYWELADVIKEADDDGAEPLDEQEKKVILRLSTAFPTKEAVFKAARRERIWKQKEIGSIIPYSDSSDLNEIEV